MENQILQGKYYIYVKAFEDSYYTITTIVSRFNAITNSTSTTYTQLSHDMNQDVFIKKNEKFFFEMDLYEIKNIIVRI